MVLRSIQLNSFASNYLRLKQKFEIASSECSLCLGDLYLLYETRFGMERPLDLAKFLVVFKIAYPELTVTGGELSTTTPDQIIVHGIQIKMAILEDCKCCWGGLFLFFAGRGSGILYKLGHKKKFILFINHDLSAISVCS